MDDLASRTARPDDPSPDAGLADEAPQDTVPADASGPGEPVTITVCSEGPMFVRGCYVLLGGEARSIDPGRPAVSLRGLVHKAFCEGSHERARFRAR
ncbi:CDGSH iron-sulfur domain-containing protein [Kocuria nitroreducens]|uniref:CDGSH iron-sulfur domain-containing protein n=1 Tax=Kocuria nitroreducens TaxID=3058914 RepID=UPI0036D92EB8